MQAEVDKVAYLFLPVPKVSFHRMVEHIHHWNKINEMLISLYEGEISFLFKEYNIYIILCQVIYVYNCVRKMVKVMIVKNNKFCDKHISARDR